MSYGIDYGLGQENIDHETGIRYGVIPQDAVWQAWADLSEPWYGEPELDDDGEDGHYNGVEVIGSTYQEDGYFCGSDDFGDIFICKSPYYTHARFCSPRAPGACHLENPVDSGGPRAYCFAPDWFDYWSEMGVEPAGVYLEIKTSCPYPVYRVSDDKCIYRPAGWTEE